MRMKEEQYRQLVSVIHRHRTWIDVADADKEDHFMIQSGGNLHPIQCRTLCLIAKWPNGPYPKGQKWSLPEYELDNAIRSLHKKATVKKRYREQGFLYTDAEAIVVRASFGLIKLELEP